MWLDQSYDLRLSYQWVHNPFAVCESNYQTATLQVNTSLLGINPLESNREKCIWGNGTPYVRLFQKYLI